MAQRTLLSGAEAAETGAWISVPARSDAYLEAEIADTATVKIEHRTSADAAVQELHEFTATGQASQEPLPGGEIRARVSAHTSGAVSVSLSYPGFPGAYPTFDTVNATVKEKPAAPTGAAATDAATPEITWDASPDPGGRKVEGYNLYRDGAFLDSVRWGVTSYTDDGSGELSAPTTGAVYTYEIRAESPEGKESDGVTATTDLEAPEAVSDLSATAGAEQAALSWTNAADSDLDTVEVHRSTTTGFTPTPGAAATLLTTVATPTPGGEESYTDDGSGELAAPSAGTTYYYKVVSADEVPNWSDASNEASAAIPAA